LFSNAVALGLQYPMIKSYPYVVLGPGAPDPAHAYVANVFNGSILWGVLSWMWLYLISAGVYAWYCAPFLRRAAQGLMRGTATEQNLKGII
jgi:hypothetical protein